MSLKKSRSILEELQQISVDRDKHFVLENRVEHIVTSVQNLKRMLHESYSPEDALDLERRLINSIKSGDSKKFSRGIKKVTESIENNNEDL
jgi:ribosomal protein L22